ncbi:MAG: hypothetical protein ACPLSK_06290, partial [bacterium]
MIDIRLSIVFFGVLFAFACLSEAQLKLPSFFSDHMVLQRGEKIRVWGIAPPGTTVKVKLA